MKREKTTNQKKRHSHTCWQWRKFLMAPALAGSPLQPGLWMKQSKSKLRPGAFWTFKTAVCKQRWNTFLREKFCFDFPTPRKNRQPYSWYGYNDKPKDNEGRGHVSQLNHCLRNLWKGHISLQRRHNISKGAGHGLRKPGCSHRPQCVVMQKALICPHSDSLLCRSLRGRLSATAMGASHGSSRKTCVGGQRWVRAPWAKS